MKLFNNLMLPVFFIAITSSNVIVCGGNNCMPLGKGQGYWTPTIESSSQREPLYTLSRYVAEPLCALANTGFFYGAYLSMSQNPTTAANLALTGTISTLSHIIPQNSLNNLENVGTLMSVAQIAYSYNLFNTTALSNPAIVPAMIAAAALSVDTGLAHTKCGNALRKTFGSYIQTITYMTWRLFLAYSIVMLLSKVA